MSAVIVHPYIPLLRDQVNKNYSWCLGTKENMENEVSDTWAQNYGISYRTITRQELNAAPVKMEIEATQAIPLSDYDDGDETDEEALDGPKKPVAHLKVFVQRGFPETLFPVYEGINMIGRAPGCNIHIDLKALSKQHAVIEVQGTEHFLIDKGSKNKTRRNKIFLKPEVRYEIRGGEKLMFADVECTYLMLEREPLIKHEVKQESYVYEEDDSDPSSDILQTTQAYGDEPQQPSSKRVNFSGAATQFYAADSEDSDDDLKRPISTAKRHVVAETPVASHPRKRGSEEMVIPDSDGEPSPVANLSTMSRVSAALTETVCYHSDVDDGEEPGRSRDQAAGGRGGQLAMAATQAYGVRDSDDAETDDEGAVPPKPFTAGTKQATQGYGMDDDDTDTTSKLKGKARKRTKRTASAQQNTSGEPATSSPRSHSGDDDPTDTYSMRGRRYKRKIFFDYEESAVMGMVTLVNKAIIKRRKQEQVETKKCTRPQRLEKLTCITAPEVTWEGGNLGQGTESTEWKKEKGKRKKRKCQPHVISEEDEKHVVDFCYRELAEGKLLLRCNIRTFIKELLEKRLHSRRVNNKTFPNRQWFNAFFQRHPRMVSLSRRVTVPYQKYDKQAMRAAVREVLAGERNISQAAREHGVKRKTLSDQVRQARSGEVKKSRRSEGQRQLTPEEEQELVNYWREKQRLGQTPHRTTIRPFILDLVRRKNKKSKFNMKRGPSDGWFGRFLKRYPDLKEAPVPSAFKAQKMQYAESALQEAVDLVTEKKMTYTKAAKTFCVPRKSIYSRMESIVLDRPESSEFCQRLAKLTDAEEKILLEYCRFQYSVGVPLARKHVSQNVLELLRRSKCERRRRVEKGPSGMWVDRYLRRHPELQPYMDLNYKPLRKPPKIDVKKSVNQFFERYESTLARLGLHDRPAQVFTCHEAVFGGRIFPVSTQDSQDCQASEHAHMSAHVCVSGAGFLMPTYVIHKHETAPPGLGDELPAEWVAGSSKNGLMDRALFTQWFTEIFLPNCGEESPVLLLLTRPGSDLSLDVIDQAIAQQIEFLTIPAGTHSLLQPLEEQIFKPLKEKEREIVEASGIMQYWDLPQVLQYAMDDVCTDERVRDSFKACGLMPCDPSAISVT